MLLKCLPRKYPNLLWRSLQQTRNVPVAWKYFFQREAHQIIGDCKCCARRGPPGLVAKELREFLWIALQQLQDSCAASYLMLMTLLP